MYYGNVNVCCLISLIRMTFELDESWNHSLTPLFLVLFTASIVWTLWCVLWRWLARAIFIHFTLWIESTKFRWISNNIPLDSGQGTHQWTHVRRIITKLTFRKLHIELTVLVLEFFGVMNITAAKQTIWKNAPTYKPYRIIDDKRLSCGISNASILLYAMNNNTFMTRRKHDISYAVRNARDCFFLVCFLGFVFVWWASIVASCYCYRQHINLSVGRSANVLVMALQRENFLWNKWLGTLLGRKRMDQTTSLACERCNSASILFCFACRQHKQQLRSIMKTVVDQRSMTYEERLAPFER